MLKLPKPTNFEQGQRQLFGWGLFLSGVFSGLVALGLVIYLTAAANAFSDHRDLILYALAGALGAYLVLQSIVMIAMAVGGPVGRFKVSATKQGASLEAVGDGEPIEPTVSNPAPEDIPHE